MKYKKGGIYTMDLEKLKKEALSNNHSLNLVKKHLELRDINETRLWLGWGNIEYLLDLHELFKEQNNIL